MIISTIIIIITMRNGARRRETARDGARRRETARDGETGRILPEAPGGFRKLPEASGRRLPEAPGGFRKLPAGGFRRENVEDVRVFEICENFREFWRF